MEIVELIALILVIVGGLNWGLVVLDFNLVEALLGNWPVLVKTVYALVGLSALYMIYVKITKK